MQRELAVFIPAVYYFFADNQSALVFFDFFEQYKSFFSIRIRHNSLAILLAASPLIIQNQRFAMDDCLRRLFKSEVGAAVFFEQAIRHGILQFRIFKMFHLIFQNGDQFFRRPFGGAERQQTDFARLQRLPPFDVFFRETEQHFAVFVQPRNFGQILQIGKRHVHAIERLVVVAIVDNGHQEIALRILPQCRLYGWQRDIVG